MSVVRSIRYVLPVVVLLLAAACATSAPTANTTQPQITIEQLPASEFQVENQGAVSMAYKMTVRNPSSEAVTLKRVDMKTVGRSPYLLRETPNDFNETIAPGAESVVTLQMWAIPRAEKSKNVWVHGVAHFEKAGGNFDTVFEQSFAQPD